MIGRGAGLAALALIFVTQTKAGAPPPPGKLVDAGGYRVHLYCTGAGSPTVVITGAGYSFDWGLVQPEVAQLTRVCSYDHSGIAWSDPGPADSCPLRIGEIHAALKNAHIAGPYVLVGHSLGALVSRLYASRYPAEVAGMVIVDHAGVVRMPAKPGAPLPPLPGPNTGFEKLPARDYQLHLWWNAQPDRPNVKNRMVEMLPECTAQVEAATRGQQHPLGAKPLIALSQPAGAEMHSGLLSLSTNSKQMIAEDSGHYVMIDRPDMVITAIREVVEAVRNHARLH